MENTTLKSLPVTRAAKQIYQRLYGKYEWWKFCGQSVLRYGIPKLILSYGDGRGGVGIGDDLMCTTVLHELRQRGYQRLWMMSRYPDLFLYNSEINAVVPPDGRYKWLAQKFRGRQINLKYVEYIEEEDRDIPPARHIISCICQQAGITGTVTLKPYFTLLDKEREQGQLFPQQIVIQSAGLGAQLPIKNKQWYPERFQTVVSALKSEYNFIQLGTPTDPPLEGALDLRGKTSIREAAAILSRSLVFVGQIGFLMHLARAVDCRSVIVYGGRELPSQTGYTCNENISSLLECSPCWKWNLCDYDRECMNKISPEMVMEATERQIARYGESLPLDTDVIA